MAHPEVTPDEELCAEIAHNYKLYRQEPQERDKSGQLIDPLARMFEQRMNANLQQLSDLTRFLGQTVVQEMGHDQVA